MTVAEKPIRLYYFEWCDAQTLVEGWHSREEASEWAKNDDWVVRQTGYLIAETEKCLVIAGKYNPQMDREDQFAEITKIPKTWIKRKRRVVEK